MNIHVVRAVVKKYRPTLKTRIWLVLMQLKPKGIVYVPKP